MPKGDGGWLLPSEINPSRKSFCISIPNEPNHVLAFFGALQNLAHWWEWQRDEGKTGTLVAQVWRDVIKNAYDSWLEGECMAPCDCPPMVRMGSDGRLEYSFDGGETWEDAPLPPYIPQPPTPEGQDRRCLASRNAVEVYRLVYNEWQHLVDEQLEPLVVLAALISFIGALILFPPAIGALWQYFSGIFGAFEALSVNDWTSDDTAELTCILYCNSRINQGVVTFDYPQIVIDIGNRIPTHQLFAAIAYIGVIVGGEDGLNRAAQTTSITSYDCQNLCSGCGGDWCAVIDFSSYIDNFEIMEGELDFDGLITLPASKAYPYQQAGRQLALVRVELPANCQVCGCLDVEFTLLANGSYSSAGRMEPTGQLTNGTGGLSIQAGDYTVPFVNNTCRPNAKYWTFYMAVQSTSVKIRVRKLRVFGTGLNPFYDNSCAPILG